jgi:hypothetical protein
LPGRRGRSGPGSLRESPGSACLRGCSCLLLVGGRHGGPEPLAAAPTLAEPILGCHLVRVPRSLRVTSRTGSVRSMPGSVAGSRRPRLHAGMVSRPPLAGRPRGTTQAAARRPPAPGRSHFLQEAERLTDQLGGIQRLRDGHHDGCGGEVLVQEPREFVTVEGGMWAPLLRAWGLASPGLFSLLPQR